MSGVAGSDQGFSVRGWCPGALRPMLSGDGLVVRVRPRLGRFSQLQAAGIARASVRHGSGVIDFTSRANLQIRGVRADALAAAIGDLDALGLVDATEALEARRNIVVTPFADDAVMRIGRAVEAVLPDLPPLPGKFGFAVDCGAHRVLAEVSADIRIERSEHGTILLRADGMEKGWQIDDAALPDALAKLVNGFVASGGNKNSQTRMAHVTQTHRTTLDEVFAGLGPPRFAAGPAVQAPNPGLYPLGALVGFAFGQTDATTLSALAALGPIRVTPWRMILVEGLRVLPDFPGLITDLADPLHRVVACTGAPICPQGLAPTRTLARALAMSVPAGKVLHITGCAKGCAHPGVADVTLVAAGGGFHVIRNGTARDTALVAAISADALTADPVLIKGMF